MMDRDDQEIRRIFEQARQADRAQQAPTFRAMVDPESRPRPAPPVRLSVAVGAAGGTALVLLAWLAVSRSPDLPGPAPSGAPKVRVELVPKPPVSGVADAWARVADPDGAKSFGGAGGAKDETKKKDAVGLKEADLLGKLASLGSIATNDKSAMTDDAAVRIPHAPDPASVYAQESARRAEGAVLASAPARALEIAHGLSADRPSNFKLIRRVAAEQVEPGGPGFDTESYAPIRDNELRSARENPLSTFSIDVDTASYANVRRFLKSGRIPPRDAVRIEELVNYFRYDYPPPTGDAPFSVSVDMASCPWNEAHRLARIGLKGREITRGGSKGSNLVFLIDVSGSMNHPAKLPLLKSALGLLVDELDGRDDVAMVVYAGGTGVVLQPTPGSAKAEIREALDRLEAGGGTNGGAGIEAAYKLAREHFLAGGVNRVILATDGDFNLGVTSQAELLALIEKDARRGIFLTVLGFGMGNYKDSTLEMLADRGNGNYAYIDDLREARKVLVEEIGGTLVTIAKDVKIQVELNPAEVESYRLIGYENRLLAKEDFADDRKDAGEIGAGHTVTALYEIVPTGVKEDATPPVDPLRYQAPAVPSEAAVSGEMLTLKLRYKEPEGEKSRLLTYHVKDSGQDLASASADFKFAAAVAELGMLLRDPSRATDAGFDRVRSLASLGAGGDPGGYRAELLDLAERARRLRGEAKAD